MTGILNDIIDGYDPEKLSINELLDEVYDRRKRVIRLEELGAPEIIIDVERQKYVNTIEVLTKYMGINEIERLLQEKETYKSRKRK